MMHEILVSLTLPHLEELKFRSDAYPRLPLVWPHVQFISLAARSAFHDNLHLLSLSDVHITEAQLLECMAALPVLEQLELSDHVRVRWRGVDLLLITDALLRATYIPGPHCLLPHLIVLRVRSRLHFDVNVYLHFVRSRLAPG